MFRSSWRGIINRYNRQLSTTATLQGKVGCSIVKPVHHLVKIDKSKLSPRFPGLKYDKDDIRSPSFKPKETHQDRLLEHYHQTLESDMLLIGYKYGAQLKKGLKRREWDESVSPYHVNRPLRKPKGSRTQLPNVHPIKWDNIPKIDNVVINCYVNEASTNETLAIGAALQIQQITGCKPTKVYSKSDVPGWKIRKGHLMGAKVKLSGLPMNQFLATLTEIVLPRIREYKGINITSGDTFGNLAFGLNPSDVKYFPEIDANQDLWPKTFGFHVTINTTAQTDSMARTLVSSFQFPFNGSKK